MRLYHTSTQIIKHPDNKHSRDYLDFGKGFYLTTIREQAVKYAARFLRKGENAFLNEYELDDNLPDTYRVKIFETYDEEWLDYVASCRKGIEVDEYDIVFGGIADDSVYDTIDLYFSGKYTKEQALNKLIYEKPNQQVCILSGTILSDHLHFIESYSL